MLLPLIAPVVVWRGLAAEPTLPLASAVAEAETPGPLSVQLATFEAYQLSVDELPLRTRDGEAASDMVGVTTVAVTLALEPLWHCTVYVVVVFAVNVAEPLAAVELLKLFELLLLGDGHDHETVT